MSVVIGNYDITSYINQGGISESTQRVYASGSSSSTAESKGAHNAYSLSAQVPKNIKNALSAYMLSSSVACSVDGVSFNAEMTDFSASIYVDIEDISLWNVSFTVTDISLTEE